MLNLKSLNADSKNSIFDDSEKFERVSFIDINELKDFFSIEDNSKKGNDKVSSMKEKKNGEISLSLYIENKNKYATTYVLCKKYNIEEIIKTIPLLLQDTKEDISNEGYEVITNYEILFTLNQIFPSVNEIKAISALNISKSEQLSLTDRLFHVLSSYPSIKTYIDSLISLYDIRSEVLSQLSFMNSLNSAYEIILSSSKLKFVVCVVLKIANVINKANGMNEIKSFDFLSFDSVIEMKNRNKNFFELISKSYIATYGNEEIFTVKERAVLNSVSDKLKYMNITKAEIEKTKKSFTMNYQKIETVIIDERLKKSIENEFIDTFYNDVIEVKMNTLQEKIEKNEIKIRNYFLYDNKGKFTDFIIGVLSIIEKIHTKLKKAFETVTPTHHIKSHSKVIEEDKENEDRTNVAPRSTVIENPEKVKFIINGNVIDKEMIKKTKEMKISSKKKFSLLSNKYNL